jgi:uncharacterized protein (DUF1810 family)
MTTLTPESEALAARFLPPQDRVYPQVLGELRAGAKRTHWMWFVFPQLAGLGRSETAQYYALENLDQAQAYFAHPVLGARLRECTEAVLLHAPDGPAPRSLGTIFGTPDDLKFISSMTLFARAVPDEPLFAQALEHFNGGRADAATLRLLGL